MTNFNARKGFAIGGRGVYQCQCCKRNTRWTDDRTATDAQLCQQCFELAGWENQIQDSPNGVDDLHPNDKATIESYVKEIIRLGGTPDIGMFTWMKAAPAVKPEPPAANEMPHQEFNRRWEKVWEDIEKHLTADTQSEGYLDNVKRICTELYLLQQELPPSSRRYHLAEDILVTWGKDNITTTAATDTKAVKKLVWADPKLRPEQKASRGKTYKTSPQDRAEARLMAAKASYDAHHEALQAAKKTLAQAEVDFKAAYDKFISVAEEVKALKPQRGGTPKAASAAAPAKPKAPAKAHTGEPGEAQKMVLLAVSKDQSNVKGLTPQQFSAARMHLSMKKLVVKDAKGHYTVTEAGAKYLPAAPAKAASKKAAKK